MEVIEIVRTNNIRLKYTNELEYLNQNGALNIFVNGQDHDMEMRKQSLENMLKIEPTVVTNKPKETKEDIFKEIDKYTYRKQWNKLIAFHKIVKIREYINEHVTDLEMQKEIIEKLKVYAEENRINTKKYVVYDPNAEKILSFPCLIIDNEKNTYQIKIV